MAHPYALDTNLLKLSDICQFQLYWNMEQYNQNLTLKLERVDLGNQLVAYR